MSCRRIGDNFDMTWRWLYLKDSLRLTFGWRLDDFGRLLDDFRVTFIYVLSFLVCFKCRAGSEISRAFDDGSTIMLLLTLLIMYVILFFTFEIHLKNWQTWDFPSDTFNHEKLSARHFQHWDLCTFKLRVLSHLQSRLARYF